MLELERDQPCVMVIDDVPEVRMVIGDMCREMGFVTVLEASDGADALEKLRDQRAHLILCDQQMERMTGLDLLNQIRNHPYLADIPFIVLSVVSEAPVIETALDLGAADYLLKPVDFRALRESVSEVIRRRVA